LYINFPRLNISINSPFLDLTRYSSSNSSPVGQVVGRVSENLSIKDLVSEIMAGAEKTRKRFV